MRKIKRSALIGSMLVLIVMLCFAVSACGPEEPSATDYSKYKYADFQKELEYDEVEDKYPDGCWEVWDEKEVKYQIICDFTKGVLDFGGTSGMASRMPTIINLYTDGSVCGWSINTMNSAGYIIDSNYMLQSVVFGYWTEADTVLTCMLSIDTRYEYLDYTVSPADNIFEMSFPFVSTFIRQTMILQEAVQFETLHAFYVSRTAK